MPRSSLAKNFFVLSITAALVTFAAKASFAQKLFDEARFGLSHRKPRKTADAIILRYARDQLPPTSPHGGTRRPGQPLDEEGCLYRARRVLFVRDGLLKNEMLTPAERAALTDELLAIVHGSNRHDGEAFHLLAILSFHEDKIHRATVYSARAARAAPKSSCYASNFGYFLQTRGSQDEAQILYEHARKLDPTNTATHLGLLTLSAESGNFDEIEVLLDEWIRYEPVPTLRVLAGKIRSAIRSIRQRRAEYESMRTTYAIDATDSDLNTLRKVLGSLTTPPTSTRPPRP